MRSSRWTTLALACTAGLLAGLITAPAAVATEPPPASPPVAALVDAAYPRTREAVVNAWATAWFARNKQAAARYENHPGPGAKPYDRLPRFAKTWRDRVDCYYGGVVCSFQMSDSPVPGVYVRKVKGQWKVIGVYLGGNSLEPLLIDRDYGRYRCVTRTTWLWDSNASFQQPASSVMKVPAGTVVRTGGEPEWPYPSVVWGKWYGALKVTQDQLPLLFPSSFAAMAAECRQYAGL